MRTILNEVLNQKVPVRQSGTVKHISLEEAFIKKLVEGALNGSMSDKIRLLKEVGHLLPERFKEPIELERLTVQYVLPDGKTMEDYDRLENETEFG